ncbi:HYR domain-containing protein [Archangium lansingense]|uniref:HYR domain-containing protein n=1 Tax=Archangium lansingense TaxID=2995310 RepID=A0ABT3ZYW1_9BACT|nr:HYR domain-containing protein [Archangium lansinium]MCY1073852.1 HYR domain-containing protein [Archangium lansinium]
MPVLLGLPSHAAGSSLLRDARSGQDDTPSACRSLVAVGNTVYFSSESASMGSELWKSDGSVGGTVLVKDVLPGPGSSTPYTFGELEGSLFFTARGSTQRLELWKTDGTPTGTVRLFTVPDEGDSSEVSITEWARVGGTLFFSAHFIGSQELWKTDGTPAGTVRVKDIVPGDVGSIPSSLTALGSTLYFSARASGGSPPSSGLWKSDGTEAGTVQVWSPPSSGSVIGVDEVGGSLLVQVMSSSSTESSLWKSDGTAAGTVKVVDLPHVVLERAVLGGQLVLWMEEEVWVTDGTAGGTRRLQAVSRDRLRPSMVVVGGQAFFLGSDPSRGLELWTTDGTESGTRPVKDLLPGGNGALGAMTALGGTVYFMGKDTAGAVQLWKTDGTEAGTVKVAELPVERTSSSYSMASAGGRLFFTHEDRLWVSDGTAAGTVRLVSSRPEPRGSNPYRMTRLGGGAIFASHDSENGHTLWKTDGTVAGTVRVKDLRQGSGLLALDSPEPWVVRGDVAFFFASELPVGGWLQRSLWRTDGTEAGTSRLKKLDGFFGEGWPLALVGDTLFLALSDSTRGVELWKTDGTAEGTVLVKDVKPGSGSSQPVQAAALGNRLFFWADDGTHGVELWTSDGTEAGTVLFKEFAPGLASGLGESELRRPLMAVLDGTLYFGARDTAHGLELWKTDGTVEGTVLVKDVNPGSWDSLSRMTAVGGRLYLSLYDEAHGLEPWVSDGTEAGTVRLADVKPGEASGSPLGFTRVGDTVLFLARDTAHGAELWKTDGTPAGTALLADVWPGPDSALRFDSRTGEVALWGVEELGLAFFMGTEASSGQELWVTDGTAAGTRQVEDLVPGEGSSTPSNLVYLGGKLVFAAMDPLVGNEPRVLQWGLTPDTTAPVLTCPASLSSTAPDANGMAVSYNPASATDDRDTPVIEYGQASGSLFPVGTTAVTVTATDSAGNRSSCTFEVTVKTEPTEPAPRPEGFACSSGGPGASAFWILLALLAVACVRRRESPR